MLESKLSMSIISAEAIIKKI